MPMRVRRANQTCATLLIMRVALRFAVIGLLASPLLSACTRSSGGASSLLTGTYSAESGGGSGSAQPEDCGTLPSFNIDADNVAERASQAEVGAQSTPLDALRAGLTHGSPPYFGGSGGSGLVGFGYPAAGWTEVSAMGETATFQAPLHSGTAKLTFTRVGSRWLISHGEKDC
ncbi:MAG: hypothetical protein QOH57_1671 [Mycobacterium sp.]|nr:hypothetical protein [Mycobacterium sp.]